MASSGLLLLLVVLSSFLICSLSVPQTSNLQENRALQKRGKPLETAKTLGKDTLAFLNRIEPLIALIPYAGQYLSAVIKVLTDGGGDSSEKIISKLKSEFAELHSKLENQLITMTWNTWASGPYQEVESNIKLAWKSFDELLEKCQNPCFTPENKNKHKGLFKELHSNLVFAPDKLHMLLTTKQPSFITGFKVLLTDHARCHEESIEYFTALITELMFKSNIINFFYYKLHEVNKEDEMAKMTFETFSVMSEIHRFCIENPEKYIVKDVFDLIDENQDRQKLAKDIKAFLAKTYNRYDWMVVAFITRHSKYKDFFNKFRNRHYLDGVTEVSKGEVTVAVAKQIAGNYTMVEKVKEAIKNCLKSGVECGNVISSLKSCLEISPFADHYTAVHAYIDESHDSAETSNETEIPFFMDVESSSTPKYIYTGDCKKNMVLKGGHFRVMIRSDEDVNREDPCKNVNCGKNGKCVTLKNIQKAVCECDKDYTGSKCDISLDDYKKIIREGMPKL